MFYGIVTQQIPGYTERQLRAYPLASQRIEDGAQVVPAARARRFSRRLRTPHVSAVLPGGIKAVFLSKDEAEGLMAS